MARRPVPCNIITGALGVGKTTSIQRILAAKPEGEKWAVLVNEFGAVGIDGALLEAAAAGGAAAGRTSAGPGVVVRELAGGCMCCTLSGPLGVAIAQVLRNLKPDRLIIEPSGLGHPAGLIDTIQNEHLRSAIELKAIICLVDACQGAAVPSSNDTYFDQVSVADVLVGHKADLASPEQLSAFEEWACSLWPPKLEVLTAAQGQIPRLAELLDLPRSATHQPLFKASHTSRRRRQQQQRTQQGGDPGQSRAEQSSEGVTEEATQQQGAQQGAGGGDASGQDGGEEPVRVSAAGAASPSTGMPTRLLSHGGQHVACGWLIHRDEIFDREALKQLLLELHAAPCVVRIKGVFRVSEKQWVSPQFSSGEQGGPGECGLQPLSYRRESRLELIVHMPQQSQDSSSSSDLAGSLAQAAARQDWGELELAMMKARKPEM